MGTLRVGDKVRIISKSTGASFDKTKQSNYFSPTGIIVAKNSGYFTVAYNDEMALTSDGDFYLAKDLVLEEIFEFEKELDKLFDI